MMMTKTLYKKDSKGKIRIWKIETDGAYLNQFSGLIDGKLVLHQKECKGKNIGKSNQTTPEQQALLELESEYKGKLTEGYFETKEQAENELVILPMLAKSYDDEKHKIDWSNCVYIQPKLDGMRCLAIINNGVVILKSRDGKVIDNMDHIINDLSQIKENVILDGELYAHGISFQENMKLIKKYRKGETEKIKYHVYDVIADVQFKDRNFRRYIRGLTQCVEVNTYITCNEADLIKWHSKFITEGYEGSIVRHGTKPYGIDKRCDSLLKYKDFQDVTAEIIDIIPNEANAKHGTPVLKFSNKLTFKAGVKLSHEDREDLLTNKHNYIGKMAEIRFFEYTDDGLPRFPVMYGVRLDK